MTRRALEANRKAEKSNLIKFILVIVLTKAAPALVIKWSGEYFLKWNNRLFLPFLNQSGNFRTKTFHYTQCIH